MSGAPSDHYAVLEIARTATLVEIRAAYRRLAREHHPDANPGADAEVRMRRINEAWEILRDPAKRTAYDRLLPRPVVRAVRRQPPPRAPRERPKTDWFAEDAPRASAASVEYHGYLAVNWYREIGVREDAPAHEIRKALARMAAQMNGADISATEFTRRRNLMREAWAVLGDQYMRAAYDRARKASAQAPPPAGERPPAGRRPRVEPPPGYRLGPVTINGHVLDKDASLPGVDLRGADLRGLDLAGIDLRQASLQGADLEAASLRRANLEAADLSGANLRYADLSNANCTAATLRQADLTGAALQAANFFRANLAGASLADAVGPGINLDYADLARADFTGAQITPQLIARGKLENTILPNGTKSEDPR